VSPFAIVFSGRAACVELHSGPCDLPGHDKIIVASDTVWEAQPHFVRLHFETFNAVDGKSVVFLGLGRQIARAKLGFPEGFFRSKLGFPEEVQEEEGEAEE